MRLSFVTLLLLVPVALADEVEPKEKKAAGLPKVRGGFKEPVKITSQQELEKAVEDKEARATILKEVDLKKEFLLLFQWAGSSRDVLEMQERDNVQTFTYYRGRTKDLRMHVKLFALPLKTEYVLPKAPYPLAK
jgi:hypothetical protein